MNPYAQYLGDRDPLSVMVATPGRLRDLASAFGGERVNRAPAPGKWSAREIACHLADCEVAFAFRLRQAAAQDDHVVQPYDQDQWAKNYGAYDTAAALATFSAVRQWNLEFLRGLPASAFSRRMRHPERGVMTMQTLVETIAGHDLNHLGQIERLV